ncbi:MAG: FtsW/RodA/SpoVE family cell cycle protein [Phycisphaerae bacterium]|nr:FtsW/RodA/SpoVE family cell cycle protein [Phycisphaerae bacterium]
MPRTPDKLPLRHNASGQALMLATLSLLALGVVLVHSAGVSVDEPGAWYARREVRHTLFAVVAAVVLLLAWRFDYRWLARGRHMPVLAAAGLLLAIGCGVLVFTPLGKSINGHRRWLQFGPPQYGIGFQPSEVIKLALIVFLAAWFGRSDTARRSGRAFGVGLLAVAAAVAPVVTEDFGTAAVIVLAAGVTMLLSGVPITYLLGLVVAGAAGFYALVYRVPYRWNRVLAMVDPWSSTHASSYQPRQSLTGIVSGGWTGKGPGAGMQKLFLPERSTDFIFSVFCEEWGFVGAMLLFGLVALWIVVARRAAVRSPDRFGRVLAGSLGFVIAAQAVLHVAVDLVVAPPTGMAFPFISAGGTALAIMAAAVGLMVSVTAHGPPDSAAPDDETS